MMPRRKGKALRRKLVRYARAILIPASITSTGALNTGLVSSYWVTAFGKNDYGILVQSMIGFILGPHRSTARVSFPSSGT